MTILPTKILALDQPNDIEVEQVFVGTGPGADAQPAKNPVFRPASQAAAMQHYSWTNSRQPVISAGPAGPLE